MGVCKLVRCIFASTWPWGHRRQGRCEAKMMMHVMVNFLPERYLSFKVCWWLGDVLGLGFSSHSIDLFRTGYSSFLTRGIEFITATHIKSDMKLTPSTPELNVYHARTHFREKGGIFSMGGANSRNQEKGVILQAWVLEILKKGNILHVCIIICSFRMFKWFCTNVKVMKNTTYIEKCIEFDAVTYILTITKGYFSLYDEKNRVLLKKGCFIEPQNQRFRLKKGCFFSSKIRQKGGVFQTWVRAWYTLWSGVGCRELTPDLYSKLTFMHASCC